MSSEVQNNLKTNNFRQKHNSFFSHFTLFNKNIKNEELLLFTKNFASLAKDNLSIVTSLETLLKKNNNEKLREIINESIDKVKTGIPLHVCFRKHIDFFGVTYCDLIEKGEESGRIDKVLDRLSDTLEQTRELEDELDIFFSYISKITVFSFFQIILLMACFVPPFSFLYLKYNKPYFTELVLNIGIWFQHYALYILGITFFIVILIYLINSFKTGKYLIDYLKLKIPLFGILIKKYWFIRYARNFVSAFNSGISLVSSMKISNEVVYNLFLKKKLEKVTSYIEEGLPIAKAFSNANFLSKKTMYTIEEGEESGRIDGMFTEIANNYEKETFDSIKQITILVKPIGFFIMSVICGSVVIALFLPLFSIIKDNF